MASLVTEDENQAAVTKSSSSGGRRKAFFMFVRFQPPHSFHIELIRSTCEKALREGADVYVFVSPNNKPPNKNPIEYHKKIELLERIYTHIHGGVPFYTSLTGITCTEALNALHVAYGEKKGNTRESIEEEKMKEKPRAAKMKPGAYTMAVEEVHELCSQGPLDFIPRTLYAAATSLLEKYDDIEYFCGGDHCRARIKTDFEEWQNGTSWLNKQKYVGKTLEVILQGGLDEKTGRVGEVSGTTCRELARKIYSTLKQTSSEKDSGLTDENKNQIREELSEDVSDEEKEILIDMIQAIGSRGNTEHENLGDLGQNLNDLRGFIFQLEDTSNKKQKPNKDGGMRKKKTKSLFRKKRTKKRRRNKMNSPNHCCAGPGCPEWKHCINVLGDGDKPKSKNTLKIMKKCGKRYTSLGKKYKKCMKKERKKLRRKTRKRRRKTRRKSRRK